MTPSPRTALNRRNAAAALTTLLLAAALYMISRYHYLLFHSIAEMFSIVIACAVFMISWNARTLTEDHHLVYLGIAYLFIAILDLFHTLSYKGMNIFTDYDYYANQLWIAARYMESLTLLGFSLLVGRDRRFPPAGVFLFYGVLTALVLASVFSWRIFPVCFVAERGLTPFKVVSEYIICGILVAALIGLVRNRPAFDPLIFRLLTWSIGLTIGGELAFTFYISNYGFSNLVGHLLKIGSFFLIYKAIIETGLKKPFRLIFNRLKASEQRYKNLFDTAVVGIFRTSLDGNRILAANHAIARIFGYATPDALMADGFVPRKCYADPRQRSVFREKLERDGQVDNFEVEVRDREGTPRWLAFSAALYPEEGYVEGAAMDITEQVEIKNRMAESAEQEAIQRGKVEMASSVLHDIGNAVTGLGTVINRLLGETEWPEAGAARRLVRLARENRDRLDEALGTGKGEALETFASELEKSLGQRSGRLHQDCLAMSRTLAHVNEILHLQRRYARSRPGTGANPKLTEVIEDALAMHDGIFEKRRITPRRRFHAPHASVAMDRTRMIQVFLNLFKNICESVDGCDVRRERRLEIEIAEHTPEGVRVVLTDDGMGFDDETGPRLFEAGFSTKNRDSGMGLAQCRSILEAHGGSIRMESAGRGKGARTIIELPTMEVPGR